MMQATKQRKRSRPRPPRQRKQKTVDGVSAIQARLITARDEVKSKTNEWEKCKERVSVERSKLNILKKKIEDADASKSIKCTAGPSTSGYAQTVTKEESYSPLAPKKIKPLYVDQPSSSKVDVEEDLEKVLRFGQVPEIVPNLNARRLRIVKNEVWEKCKERVRAERERLSKKE